VGLSKIVAIDGAGECNGDGSPPSPTDSPNQPITLSATAPSTQFNQMPQDNHRDVIHLNGLDDRAKEHLKAFVGCYSVALSNVRQIVVYSRSLRELTANVDCVS
jgi:hypothetical protein